MLNPTPIAQLTFDALELESAHPPLLRNRNKKLVYDLSGGAGAALPGQITYSRYAAATLPRAIEPAAPTIDARPDIYDYARFEPNTSALEWHVNFADPQLFFAYGSPLLAQDEMQVAEHPVLASLLEALRARGEPAITVDADGPTPVLIRSAQRRVRIAVEPDPAQGRPSGLYGNRFAAAAPEVIERAVHRIDPPTITNLIAIAAPSGGTGVYDKSEIQHILTTAATAFAAARLETTATLAPPSRTTIHTGFWGCGAFGGNKTLMSILQILAAQLAGVSRLVFHTFDRPGLDVIARAQATLSALLQRNPTLGDLVDRLEAEEFEWGVSDGN